MCFSSTSGGAKRPAAGVCLRPIHSAASPEGGGRRPLRSICARLKKSGSTILSRSTSWCRHVAASLTRKTLACAVLPHDKGSRVCDRCSKGQPAAASASAYGGRRTETPARCQSANGPITSASKRPIVSYHRYAPRGSKNIQVFNARYEGGGWYQYQATDLSSHLGLGIHTAHRAHSGGPVGSPCRLAQCGVRPTPLEVSPEDAFCRGPPRGRGYGLLVGCGGCLPASAAVAP